MRPWRERVIAGALPRRALDASSPTSLPDRLEVRDEGRTLVVKKSAEPAGAAARPWPPGSAPVLAGPRRPGPPCCVVLH